MFVDGYACVVPSVKIVPKQHDHFGGAVSRLPNVGNSTTSVEQWAPSRIRYTTALVPWEHELHGWSVPILANHLD